MTPPRRPSVVPATRGDIDRLESNIRENTRDIIGYVRDATTRLDGEVKDVKQTLVSVKEELGDINTKLDAIMSGDVLVTRTQFLKLVHPAPRPYSRGLWARPWRG